jgi:hypothetical protein
VNDKSDRSNSFKSIYSIVHKNKSDKKGSVRIVFNYEITQLLLIDRLSFAQS